VVAKVLRMWVPSGEKARSVVPPWRLVLSLSTNPLPPVINSDRFKQTRRRA